MHTMLRSSGYKTCVRCIMDTTDPDIQFDAEGVCNHCHHFDRVTRDGLFHGTDAESRLHRIVEQIKSSGRGRAYDCVIGVSGGVDSTYVAYMMKQLGLHPLAVHLDNGWNHELAVNNIEKVLRRLEIDLYTHVIDWPEFSDLQLSFLKASTPDGEIPTDHAIVALLYQVAAREKIKHIVLGTNLVSESIMPLKWGYGYSDFRYIKTVHKTFGTRPLKTFPHYSLIRLFEYTVMRGIRLVPILNYLDYDRAKAMQTLEKDLGWAYYGGKHYESIYTRFFQAYVLPRKFNIDKRKAHYSNLILSGQLDRVEALKMLETPLYQSEKQELDRRYAVKKLNITETEFDRIMALQPRTFFDYDTNYTLTQHLKKFETLRSFVKLKI